MPSHWRSKGSNGRRDDGRQKNRQKKAPQKDGEGDTASFSAYGTTQVNILTVKEVNLAVSDEQRQMMNDPFSGFGPLSPAGMMSPFGR